MMYYVNPQSNAGVYREGKWKLVWKQTTKYSNNNYTEPAEGLRSNTEQKYQAFTKQIHNLYKTCINQVVS